MALMSGLAIVGKAQLRVNPPTKWLAVPTLISSFPVQPFLWASATDKAPLVSPVSHTGPTTLPSAYRFEDLALFCRIEVQLEKVTKIPVRFRLGSVDYVDYLEGKRDAPARTNW